MNKDVYIIIVRSFSPSECTKICVNRSCSPRPHWGAYTE